jgi:hypothetical protein
MLKKFAKIKDSLQIAANHEDCNIEMHNLLHPDFAKQADTLNVLFANISLVTKILQRRQEVTRYYCARKRSAQG